MKQVVIINNNLKMSKGKIARVCLMLGYKSYLMLPILMRKEWSLLHYSKGVILKSDNYEEILQYLSSNDIKYEQHIDKGLTQVPSLSNCGVVFFCEDKKHEIIENLKLL